MIYEPLPLPGSYILHLEPIEDERGFFARSWCRDEFRAQGLNPEILQCNVSSNKRRGTLRGLHYQVSPNAEAKLVRCFRGAIYDVVVDLRRDSPTFRHWAAVELTAENYKALYVPEGLAHGFQTLCDESDIFYQMTAPYAPGGARGVRWDDPSFGIIWPIPNPLLSERDRNHPVFPGEPLARQCESS